MNRPLNRATPKLPAGAMKTYQIVAPLQTHFRRATCAEVGCKPYTEGWQLIKEKLSAELLHTIKEFKFQYSEVPVREGETWLVFPPGQRCFKAATHRIRIERPELFVVRGGDWRGNPAGIEPLVHSGADAWVDDFATHQEKLANEGRKG